MRTVRLIIAGGIMAATLSAAPTPVRTAAVPGADIVIAERGIPKATIVIPAADIDAGKGQKLYALAAKEFSSFVERSTGAKIPVVTEDKAPAGTLILIGEGTIAKQYKITAADLPLEGFRVTAFARGLAIVGRIPTVKEGWAYTQNAQAGTLYGIYDVLERFLGVRWYYPGDDGEVVPKCESLIIPSITYSDAPYRIKRDPWPGSIKGMTNVDFFLFQARIRHGVSTPISTGCHTPANFNMHSNEYPECFRLNGDGTRDVTFPCYGNPKTVDVMMSDLERFYENGDKRPWTRKDGSLWQPPTASTVHISPPDEGVSCNCEYCKPLIDTNASSIGIASRVMVKFVERMALKVKQRWPEKTVFYLPYHNYTLPVEGVRLPDNVVTGICLMRGAANAKEPTIAADHDALIEGWRKATGNAIHLWEYVCWPADCTAFPFQYPHVLKEFQMRHGKYLEGNFLNGGAGPNTLYGGMWAHQHWTLYCWMKLMWNPEFDVDAAFDEYIANMFGAAAAPMRSIYLTLIDRWEQSRWKTPPDLISGRANSISPSQVHTELAPPAEVKKLKSLLAEAERIAPNGSVERRRIDFMSQPLKIFFSESDEYHSGTSLPELRILKTSETPAIDGELSEVCWREAVRMKYKRAFAYQDEPVEGSNATYLQAVWNSDGITFGVTCEEPSIDSLVTRITTNDVRGIWDDDCIEFFLDPEGSRSQSIQFIVNANGVLMNAKKVDGVRTAARKMPGRWTAEIFIPIAGLSNAMPVAAPKINGIWYGNFTRNRPRDGKANFQRWNSKGAAAHRDFTAFGKLKFVE